VIRKVVLVGSSTFPISVPVGADIVEVIREYPEDTLFLTRSAGPFEQFISTVALALGYRCFAYPGHGSDNWERDAELAADCDELVAFIDPSRLDDTHSGTGHLIEEVLALGKPVRVATSVGNAIVWAA
jgi:hypothetical protein